MGLWSEHGTVVWVWDCGLSMGLWSEHGTVVWAWDCGLSMGLWSGHETAVWAWDCGLGTRVQRKRPCVVFTIVIYYMHLLLM